MSLETSRLERMINDLERRLDHLEQARVTDLLQYPLAHDRPTARARLATAARLFADLPGAPLHVLALIVERYLALDGRGADLDAEFECIPGWGERLSRAEVIPHPLVRRQVAAWIAAWADARS